MRKMLIGVLLIVLIAIFATMVSSELKIGEVPLGYSIKTIVNKDKELDAQIAQTEEMKQNDYTLAQTNLDTSLKKLQSQKQSYQNMIARASEEDLKSATETQQYKLDYLWTNIRIICNKK